MALRTTPSATLHRALPLEPLNWEHKSKLPRDGDVKSHVDPVTGAKTYTLHAQPRKKDRYFGVSFFEPYPQFFKQMYQYMGASALGHANQECAVLVRNSVLPDGVGIVHDGKLALPLEGDNRIECGEHYTLFANRSMPTDEFDVLYAELVENSSMPCKLEAGAEPVDIKLDMDRDPVDKLTCAVTMALDDLSSESTDPNVRWFSKLYALHLRATDMDFEDLLEFGTLASMAATALEAWSVEDGFLMASACEAQDRLAEVLECKFNRPAYQPPWVHPFQFLSGEYSDKLFDEEVKVCARAFMGDEVLKEKVKKAATEQFEALAEDPHRVMTKSCMVMHCGVTFRVECA